MIGYGWKMWLVLAIPFLSAGCARVDIREEPPEPSRAAEHVHVHWIHEPPNDPSEALRLRVQKDKSFHALLTIAGAGERGGVLLDPRSVYVTWNGEAVPFQVYYKSVGSALVFVMPNEEIFAEVPMGYLRIYGSLLGEKSTTQLGEVPILFDGTDFEMQQVARNNRRGERIQVLDESGSSIEGAWLFGQRREDLVTRSNERGFFLLDAPGRSTAITHYAWSDSHWTLPFDPVHERRLTLQSRDSSKTIDLDFVLRSTDGEAIDNALLLVSDDQYHHWENRGPLTIPVPDREGVDILVLAPGHAVRRLPIDQFLDGSEILLQHTF